MEQYLAEITAVVRETDQLFVKVGGSSRHWVRDCFIPLLEKAGFTIVPAPSPAVEQPKPIAGSHWVKGEYERLYVQVKGGKRIVCFIDNTSFNDNHPAPRDICTAKVHPEYIEFLSRGHGYATIWNDQTIDTFVKICESLHVEWLDESTPNGSQPVDPIAFAEWLTNNCIVSTGNNWRYHERWAKEITSFEAYQLYTQSLQP